jgi:hypothetical protein
MTTAATPSPTDHLAISLDEMRASMAAAAARKGLAGALAAAILAFLETLAMLLAEFRAGRLVAVPPSPRTASAASAPCAEPAAAEPPLLPPTSSARVPRCWRRSPPLRSRAGCCCVDAVCGRYGRHRTRAAPAAGATPAREGLLPLPRSGGLGREADQPGWGSFLRSGLSDAHAIPDLRPRYEIKSRIAR